ncbi:hypothetical protein Ddye_007675 [Dipteronia dyeriana]|uniref:Uncharacterized protein n=1 Tax=Dipteronia dyeriana TaxID=168575 RepID=A0AAD9XL02_9ROSI|nr:hypothetical protein Ddye_007675 [Dipteronia dyeriana]
MEKNRGKKIVNIPKSASVDQYKEVEQSEPTIFTFEKLRKRPCQDDPSTKVVVVKFLVDISVYSDPSLTLKEKFPTLTSSNTKLKKESEKTKSDSEKTNSDSGRFSKESLEKLAKAEE